jgi:hypothetical protein
MRKSPNNRKGQSCLDHYYRHSSNKVSTFPPSKVETKLPGTHLCKFESMLKLLNLSFYLYCFFNCNLIKSFGGRIRIVLIFWGVEIFFDGVLIAQFVSPYCAARVANVIGDESLSLCLCVYVCGLETSKLLRLGIAQLECCGLAKKRSSPDDLKGKRREKRIERGTCRFSYLNWLASPVIVVIHDAFKSSAPPPLPPFRSAYLMAGSLLCWSSSSKCELLMAKESARGPSGAH